MGSEVERRELQFNNLDEVVAEAERLASGEVRTTGNHSFAEILHHLALSNEMIVGDIVPPKPPLIMRLLLPLFKFTMFNDKPLKPGFNLPSDAESFFWPKGIESVGDALAKFKQSAEAYKAKGPLPKHPIFGKATAEQVNLLNCKHAAMHLSFVHPV